MPDSQAGVAAAVASTSRQVGQTLGVALTGSILGTAAASAAGPELAAAQPPGLVADRRLRRPPCSRSAPPARALGAATAARTAALREPQPAPPRRAARARGVGAGAG